jgi:hypothetical protein
LAEPFEWVIGATSSVIWILTNCDDAESRACEITRRTAAAGRLPIVPAWRAPSETLHASVRV